MARSFVIFLVLACCAACVPQVETLREYDAVEQTSMLDRVLGQSSQTSVDILALSPEIR